jgi:hypothetical protein
VSKSFIGGKKGGEDSSVTLIFFTQFSRLRLLSPVFEGGYPK